MIFPCVWFLYVFFTTNEFFVAFDTLAMNTPQELRPIVDYFEYNHIWRLKIKFTRRNHYLQQKCVLFILEIYWGLIWQKIRRSGHRHLQIQFLYKHSSFGSLLTGCEQHKKTDQLSEDFIRGGHAVLKRTKCEVYDAKILRMVLLYHIRTFLKYLRGLSHNFLIE